MLKKTIKFFRPVFIFLSRTYWFILRPNTKGVKIILTYGNEVLLVKPTYGYKYTLPGGGVKKRENIEDALRREIKEELNINLGVVTYLGSFTSTVEYKKDTVYIYATELSDKTINSNTFEVDETRWFSFQKLPNLGPVTLSALELYKITTN